MKKIILLVLTFAYLSNLYATDHMAATVAIAPDVKGPVKKVTCIIKTEQDGMLDMIYGMSKLPSPEIKYVFWYDSIGRLTEDATYPGPHIDGYVYQYYNNEMAVSYRYNEDGFIKGSSNNCFMIHSGIKFLLELIQMVNSFALILQSTIPKGLK